MYIILLLILLYSYIYSIDWNKFHNYIVTGGGDNTIVLYNPSSIDSLNNDDNIISIISKYENAHNGDINCIR